MNVEKILEQYGWNGKFFLLTRDHTVEIITLGGGYGDVPIAEKGCLFHYANQCLYRHPYNNPNREIDVFERNYLDQVFIALCMHLHIFFGGLPDVDFKSLTTRKEGDKYLVRVQYDNVDLEMEVEEMFHYVSELLKESRKGGGVSPDTPV